ncbi:hypothetical protein BSI_33930 [Bacillus inaquosorum KCTC 13429]|uniref:Uncharacterized protein n=1 Tax=Bacillus inaquosorum KCTC 13429 TaxID=1236548 RepID=A0A9W5LFR2_9BACI|nr:hypothetical protein BSI_33930 [Bacillus inaquosorum KCTC 13429]
MRIGLVSIRIFHLFPLTDHSFFDNLLEVTEYLNPHSFSVR